MERTLAHGQTTLIHDSLQWRARCRCGRSVEGDTRLEAQLALSLHIQAENRQCTHPIMARYVGTQQFCTQCGTWLIPEDA